MNGKICLVTGATAGIGLITSRVLAEKGATVIAVGRNKEKSDTLVTNIKNLTRNPNVEYILADLSSQKDIHNLVVEFTNRYERLDVLVNNAGAIFNKRLMTVDGLEMTFALNHLNYFLLTNLLLDAIKATSPSRIINVSSDAYKGMKIDFDDIQGEKKYSFMKAYGQSKLANILFTYELARRLDGSGVTVNALHPGFVATNFGTNMSGILNFFIRVAHLFAISPEKGAETMIYLATSSEVENVSGKYFYKKKEIQTSPESYDENTAKKLWQISSDLTNSSATK
jgi:NAD(P)-dependent dehydrogenase (short-subunit alcohol dehydrogenase family)